MYKNIYCDIKNNITHLWDDEIGHQSFSTIKYAYRRKIGGSYKSLYGEELEKITNFAYDDPTIFEGDLQPELRALLDLYSESDEPSKGHNIVIIDIETSTDGGFPNIDTANQPITAIALYDQTANKYYSYILDPELKVSNGEVRDAVVYSFASEENLLDCFLNKWNEIQPSIVSGWNIDGFDMPYLFNRIKAVLGNVESGRLSPIDVVYRNRRGRMVIAGVSCLDYIDLYKKFLGVMKSSYTLGNVAKDEELKNQKLTYKGNLNDLYVSDIHRFVEYNLVDVKIVVELDKKYDFIYLAQTVCHKGHIPYEWFQMSSRFIDGAILMYLHRHNLIAPNKPAGGKQEFEEKEKEGEEGFIGAYVKEPIVGLYDWIYSADITSLYPSAIMTLNISPETKVGKILNWDKIKFDKGEIPIVKLSETTSYTASEFKKMIDGYTFSISSNGVVYRQDIFGVIPTILDQWFSERVEYRALAKKCSDEGDKEKSDFYGRRQLRQKIFLNSVYGVLGLPIFRFYDKDNAEATTISGQTIIRNAEKLVNDMYLTKFKDKGVEPSDTDFVKYIDTDSLYISSVPLATLDGNVTDMTKFTIDVATEVAERINKFYGYMIPRLFNVAPNKNRIKIIPDVIAKKALWIAKKRYAMLKVYDMEKGKAVKDKNGNEGKLEVKGIDTVRSSFPAAFRKFASYSLDAILRGTDRDILDAKLLEFEETIDAHPILDLAKTSSAKFKSKDEKKEYNPQERKPFQFMNGSPSQVKAALAYNDLLKIWKLHRTVQPIENGAKIKWVYLLPNDFCIEQIALKGDDTDPDKILDFVNNHIDRQKMYDRELRSKLEEIYKCIGWKMPNRASDFAKRTFDFDDVW